MSSSFVDIHHHLAFGVDDGPKDVFGMQRMLERAAQQGIGTIFATPHVTPGVRAFAVEKYHSALEEAREYCREKELKIDIYEGCEILYTDQACRLLEEGMLPTLGETDFVLVEFSPDIRYGKIVEAIQRLSYAGFRPVIAHVERYRCLVMRPKRLLKLREEAEVYFQMNCSSVYKEKSWFTRRFVHWALENRQIDALGTDSHNTSSRPANMKKAYKAVKQKYSAGYAKHLTGAAFMFENKE